VREPPASPRFHRYTVFFLGYTVGVILWGAWVRVSLSGDGCGEHWPLCQGALIPPDRQTKTYVELAHRLTSALTGIFAIVAVVWSRRLAGPRSLLRRTAVASLVFIVFEGLVGAAQVKLGYVAENPAEARGYWAALHLANTFFMLFSMTWLMRAAGGVASPPRVFERHVAADWLGVVLLVVVAAMGAVTALGDTIFPASSFAEGLRQEAAHDAHLFVRLRVVHPLLAIAVSVFLVMRHAPRAMSDLPGRAWDRALIGLVLGQVLLGSVSVMLAAPAALQIAHLLLADLLFIVAAATLLERLGGAGEREPSARGDLAPHPTAG
jgi:heme a synthase